MNMVNLLTASVVMVRLIGIHSHMRMDRASHHIIAICHNSIGFSEVKQGALKAFKNAAGTLQNIFVQQGSYAVVDNDGTVRRVDWVADENGESSTLV